ncbi:MAG: sugar ABC transporter substrate-binding protein [Lachnospiraceae bacterium]|nr:sugar ABC transporter substrate-binding protein [Lachnospiraceae bacterium]
MKNIVRSIALIICCMIVMTSCTPAKQGGQTQGKNEDKIRIGMSFDSFIIERWQRDRDVFVSTAKEYGAEVNVQNASGDVEEQKKQIEYLIAKEMDVIVIICADSEELKDSVEKAKDAGIRVIAYDRLIKDSPVDLYISFDNAMVGTMMGEAFVNENLAGGKVLMLGGPLSDNNVEVLEAAFIEVMEKNNIRILDTVHAEGWRAEVAAEYVYNNPRLIESADAIMCGNDNLASQVVHALAENRLAGNKAVVGQDADLEACQRIVEGTQIMTVYKPVDKLARRAAEYAVMMAKGEEIPLEEAIIIENGRYEIPYVALEPVSVTKENINEVIINSGFHLKEDVYLNVPEQMP